MKNRSLISHIMLSILVILLLPTATYATEYREVNTTVNATDILEHIKNGDDVNLTDCRIVGELNVSNITLETAPSPIFNEWLKEGYLEEEIPSRLSKTSSFIENNIAIKNSIFENCLNFSNTQFNNAIDFSGTKFNAPANFTDTYFNDSANFTDTYFNDSAEFTDTCFNNCAYFYYATFNAPAEFIYTKFNAPANLETNINAPVDFCSTKFNAPVDFSGTSFNAPVYFSYTKFNALADFIGTEFNDSAYFDWTDFDDPANFTGPSTSKNIITSGKACETFMSYFKNAAQYEEADNIYYTYRKNAQDDKDLTSFSKWSDILSWATCGYGLKPLRIFWPGVFIIGFFTLFYWLGSGIYRSSDADTKKSKVSFWDGLYFSINTFTSLGSVDWYPRENFRKWVTLEGLCGWIFLGIFMATLGNILIRK